MRLTFGILFLLLSIFGKHVSAATPTPHNVVTSSDLAKLDSTRTKIIFDHLYRSGTQTTSPKSSTKPKPAPSSKSASSNAKTRRPVSYYDLVSQSVNSALIHSLYVKRKSHSLPKSSQHKVLLDDVINLHAEIAIKNNRPPKIIPKKKSRKHKKRNGGAMSLGPSHDLYGRIVIDAGHGGHDSGAIGSLGTLERDINLSFALALYRELRSRGYSPKLTRDSDRFISLLNRRKFSTKYNADLFISIHADSAPNTGASGMSIYTLSNTDVQMVMDRVLSSSDYKNASHEVATTVASIQQEVMVAKSKRFSKTLLTVAKRKNIGIFSGKAKFASFAVLKSHRTPSMLIELGFLSNPADELLLNTSSYRTKMSNVIADAIDEYYSY